MKNEKNGYWLYSTVAIVIFILLFAFFGYLVYDLILKLADKDFSNNTVIQALITLVVTVFLGGYFTKHLEIVNNKKLELYKIQTQTALTIVDYASALLYSPNDDKIKMLLVAESSKVKLYFNDETLHSLNEFIKGEDKASLYDPLIDSLKKNIK